MSGTNDDLVVIWSTWPDDASAAAAARMLIDHRLAACVVRLPSAVSVYRWQGAIEEAEEVVVVAKSRAARADAVVAALSAVHPYEVPAVLVLPVVAAAAPYAAWLREETAPSAASTEGRIALAGAPPAALGEGGHEE